MIKILPVKRTLIFIATIIGTATIVSGCSYIKDITPLPDGQRYKYINEVVEAVDLDTAGTIVGGGYDNGDGVFDPSLYRVDIEGEATYDLLNTRLKAIPDIKCQDSAKKVQTSCILGQVDITLIRDTTETQEVQFQLTDVFSGRDPR